MKSKIKSLLLPFSTVCLVLYAVFLSDRLGKFVVEGLLLTVNCVLPTGLPFMIISDLYRSLAYSSGGSIWERMFKAIFGMPRAALGCFLCGNICGFPIGAMGVGDLYKNGVIDKKRAERLIPISNNPSLSFIVGGVGLGMYKNMKAGIVLAIAVQLSAVITGMVLRKKGSIIEENDYYSSQKFSFIASVKRSGLAFVSIASFIMVFSVVAGVLETFLPESVKPIVALLLEVTRGAKFFASCGTALPLSISLCAFTLTFGGISVLMQSMALLNDLDLKFTPYVFIKLMQGIFAFIISYCLCIFIY